MDLPQKIVPYFPGQAPGICGCFYLDIAPAGSPTILYCVRHGWVKGEGLPDAIPDEMWRKKERERLRSLKERVGQY